MAWPIQPSSRPGDGIPTVMSYVVASGETFYIGAPVTYLAGLVELDTDDVTDIIGVALAGAAVAQTPDWPASTSAKVPVALNEPDQMWSSQVHSAAAILTDLSNVTVGERYGVVKLTNHWYVDYDDTSVDVVEIMDKDDDLNIVFFKFLSSTRVEAYPTS